MLSGRPLPSPGPALAIARCVYFDIIHLPIADVVQNPVRLRINKNGGIMVAEVAILLAAERSGTNLFRSILSNTPGVSALPEVCNGTVAGRLSFLKFREQASLQNPGNFYP